MDLNFKNFVEYIRDVLNNTIDVWEEAKFQINFSTGNDQGHVFRYYTREVEYKKVLSIFEYGDILDESLEPIYKKEIIRNFNKIILTITKEDFNVEYQMDEEKVIKEKQGSALIFPNYLYERMRTQIYDYELDNNLLIPVYNDRFELYDYKVSWDSGLFTFIVDEKSKQIYFEIEVSFHGEKRVIPLELINGFKESIWYHYELTHGELKEFWKPWNKMVVTAPESFIPLGRDQEYIQYSLVEVDKEEIVINTQIINTLQFETKDSSVLKYVQKNEIWGKRNYPIRLIWKHKEKEVIIEGNGTYFFFEVFKDKVVVLYHGRWSENYKHPYNLYVYKADGSILHKIEAPKFKSIEMIEGMRSEHDQKKHTDSKIWIVPPHSKTIKSFWGKVKGIDVMQGFMDVLREKRGRVTVTISDSKYFEEQYLDVEKGVFSKTAKYIGRY